MISCGTTTFTDPDDYRASVPDVAIDLSLTGSDVFTARVGWVRLRHLTLVMIEETAPRIAFLSLDPARVFLSFPVQDEAIWDGVHRRRGDFVLHGRGERLHHRTEGRLQWGLISMPAGELANCGWTLTGKELAAPDVPRLLRPGGRAATEMLRLHVHACRLAARRPDLMARREVARSVEQDLILAVVTMMSRTSVESA